MDLDRIMDRATLFTRRSNPSLAARFNVGCGHLEVCLGIGSKSSVFVIEEMDMACGSPSLGIGGTLGRRIGARCHSKCRSFGTCLGPISSHLFADKSRRMGLLFTCWRVCTFIFASLVDVAFNLHVRTCLVHACANLLLF